MFVSMLRRCVSAAACCLTALLATARARATDYVNDPLTDPSFAGRGGSRGGTFDATGWTVTGDTDTIWYEIPDAMVRGSVSFSVTNWGLTTTLTGGDMDILAVYQAPTGLPEPIDYAPAYRNNDFKVFMRIFGSADPTRPGSTKLEDFMCPQGDPWYHDACPAGCDTGGLAYWAAGADPGWDATKTYRITLSWGDGTMTLARDDGQTASVSYTGTYAPRPVRVRLGSPRNTGGGQNMPHATYKDLVISGDAGTRTPICTAVTPPDAGPSEASASSDAGVVDLSPLQDVTAASWMTGVYTDVGDLNAEAAGDGSPTGVVYLRFPPLTGKVAHAILRLHTHTDPSAAGGSGAVHSVSDLTWLETTMTWATKPAWGATVAGAEHSVDPDQDVEWDVTTIVDPANPNFAIVSSDPNGVHYFSKESGVGAQAPHLSIVYDTTSPGDSGIDGAVDALKSDASSDAKVHLDGDVPESGSGGGSDDKGGCNCATVGATRSDSSPPSLLPIGCASLATMMLVRRRRRRSSSRQSSIGE
jgi:hypothetical protein